MRKVVNEFYVYDFDELSEESKQKAIESEKEYQETSYCEDLLQEDMNEKARDLVKQYFTSDYMDDISTYYDLGYGQGSGSMIQFKVNIADLNKKYNILDKEELRYVQDKGIVNEIEIYHDNNLYYHEYTFNIKYYDNFGYWSYEDIKDDYNIGEERFNTIEDRIISLLDSYNKHNTESKFIEDIIDMNKELTRFGYDNIEYWWKDENVKEYCKEHTYYKDGSIYEY